MLQTDVNRWSSVKSAELYEIDRWSNGFFSVGADGCVHMHAKDAPDRSINLFQLIERLALRGVEAPVLLRFRDVLRCRVAELHDVFADAIVEAGYQGGYRCVYPIKVNQQRQVVEEILEFGRPYGFGLEAGSKPELLAVVALTDNDTPIICNGFKDGEFIETALMAQKIGRQVTPVVEKQTDLTLILRYAEKIGVRPSIGARAKLATPGAGRWQASGGFRSKFGLSVSEIIQSLELLKNRGMEDCFQLLHFHLGSQITNIRHIKNALTEAARIYVELHRLGAGLKYLDVGGGLGVDYDGSQTNYDSSVNYTLGEYARDVVYHVKTVCDDAGVPHPELISESGRALTAHHSVLVFNVLGVSQLGDESPPSVLDVEVEQPLKDLASAYDDLHPRNIVESFHDAQQALETALQLFNAGYLPLEQRCTAEQLYWTICRKIQRLLVEVEERPEDLRRIDVMLADTYFCNFSLFQSLPDAWAIKQLFPVMPIHRLDEEPTRMGVLGDITCDSDGKLDRFIDRRDVKRFLPLHEPSGRPYYLAAFLIGAYQEILGDLHNLFGDTNAVHVGFDAAGEVVVEGVIQGDTVRQVLDYVEFEPAVLTAKLRDSIDAAVRAGRITDVEAGRFAKAYEAGLDGYTYLEGDVE